MGSQSGYTSRVPVLSNSAVCLPSESGAYLFGGKRVNDGLETFGR